MKARPFLGPSWGKSLIGAPWGRKNKRNPIFSKQFLEKGNSVARTGFGYTIPVEGARASGNNSGVKQKQGAPATDDRRGPRSRAFSDGFPDKRSDHSLLPRDSGNRGCLGQASYCSKAELLFAT